MTIKDEALRRAIDLLEIDSPNCDVLDMCYEALRHPTHDDTALLRQAMEDLEDSNGVIVAVKHGLNPQVKQNETTITALRERLGEKA